MSYAKAAPAYLDRGFQPLPVPRGEKAPVPTGYTGADGEQPDADQVAAWCEEHPDGNVALRLPAGVLGLDVDAYGDKLGGATLGEMEEAHGALPATWRSSSRDEDPISGIRLYRIPDEVDEATLRNPAGIDLIRHGHRYMIAAPSLHPEGGTYRWHGPDGEDRGPFVNELPMLPPEHIWHLQKRCACFQTAEPHMASPSELRNTGTGQRPEDPYRRGMDAIRTGNNRHDEVRNAVMTLVWFTAAEWPEASRLLADLRTAFISAVTGDGSRSTGQAESEWDRMQEGAERRVAADPPTPYREPRAERIQAVKEDPPIIETGGIVFDVPEIPPAIVGEGHQVLMAEDEALLLYAGTGIGKTTAAQAIGLAAIGIGLPEFLGFPVKQIQGRVLYVAADRPAQALRSLRRMVQEQDRTLLDERWRWERKRRIRITPDTTTLLRDEAEREGVELVILDSVKDLVDQPSSDESGQAFNDAIQLCIVKGIQVIALHHPRKANQDGRAQLSLDDVYGSTWLTAGMGSVVALNGSAGSGTAKLQHLKMPAEEIGPFDVSIDYATGQMRTIGKRSIRSWLGERVEVTTTEAVRYVTGKEHPSATERKKVLRQLHRLVNDGDAEMMNQGKGRATVWRATEQLSQSVDEWLSSEVGHLVRHPSETPSETDQDTGKGHQAETLGMEGI